MKLDNHLRCSPVLPETTVKVHMATQAGLINVDWCAVCASVQPWCYFGIVWWGTQIYIYKSDSFCCSEKEICTVVFLKCLCQTFPKGNFVFALSGHSPGWCGRVVVEVGCSGSAVAGCEKSTQALYASDSDQFQSWGGGNLCTESRGSSLGKEQVQRSEREERNNQSWWKGRAERERGREKKTERERERERNQQLFQRQTISEPRSLLWSDNAVESCRRLLNEVIGALCGPAGYVFGLLVTFSCHENGQFFKDPGCQSLVVTLAAHQPHFPLW